MLYARQLHSPPVFSILSVLCLLLHIFFFPEYLPRTIAHLIIVFPKWYISILSQMVYFHTHEPEIKPRITYLRDPSHLSLGPHQFGAYFYI